MNSRIPRTPRLRRRLAGAALGCALVTASLAPASSALPMRPFPVPPVSGPTYARFTISVRGSRTTTWKGSTYSGGDCYYRVTWTPQGREVVRFKSVTTKLLAIDYGTAPDFMYGTWDPADFVADFWPANGSTKRLDQTTSSSGPGPCGSKPVSPPAPEDCSPARVRHWNLMLQYDNSDRMLRIEFSPVHSSRDGARGKPFNSCPLGTPTGAEGDTITPFDVPFAAAALLGVHGTHVVRAHHVWSQSGPGLTASTTVNWTLTIVRHP
jgi:hypothetical protein